MNIAIQHPLKARKVQFNFEQSPAHWIYDDVYSSHMINGINMLLPLGELWFCRVYNKALPLVTDVKLREEVQGFIRQEAVHSRAHSGALDFLRDHGYQLEDYLERVNVLFGQVLGEQPFGLKFLQNECTEKFWLMARVGVIAAIEHFTGILGQWSLDSKGWDDADPVIADLFRWHLAEEVEHRTVAFDLFEHLCKTELGFYVSRQALMAIVFPLFVYFLVDGCRYLAGQDPDPRAQAIARKSMLKMLWQLEKVGKKTDHLPTFSLLVKATLRWVPKNFHPITEGDTQQALDYIARSQGILAARKV
ncbi:metal-dependent hydrolase [Aquirhabdus sp.]|uniref:metal-dependent hydrolase n=1 Tax=Aquirhabdus sp. TaxID=2824160 RepID=UPI00396D019E